jgi:hypothetical protein
VCFSETGERIAAGDMGGQLFVYGWPGKDPLFRTEESEKVIAARIVDSRAMTLYRQRLDAVDLADPQTARAIPLPKSLAALDFDVYGDLAAVLCRPMERQMTYERYVLIAHLAEERVLLCMRIPSVAEALTDAETLQAPSPLARIRLQIGGDSGRILLGSAQGIVVYPFLSFERGYPLIVPCSVIPKDAIVFRPSPDAPTISCDVFEIARAGQLVVAGYSDSSRYPTVGGELRAWDLSRDECTHSSRLPTPVDVISSDRTGGVVIGTQDGEASSWRLQGVWQRLASVPHGVPVVAVACSDGGHIACSASNNGALVVWDTRTGAPLLRTFLDVTPAAVGFAQGDSRVCMIDDTGELHVWEMENADGVIHRAPPVPTGPRDPAKDGRYAPHGSVKRHLVAAESLGRVQLQMQEGNYEGARAAISAQPDIPPISVVREDWLLQIFIAEQRASLPEAIREALGTLEQAAEDHMMGLRWGQPALENLSKMSACLSTLKQALERLLQAGRFTEAWALAMALPRAPQPLLKARLSWLELTEACRNLDGAVTRAKELVNSGRIDQAREVMEELPDEPGVIYETKKRLLAQIEDLAAQRRHVEQVISSTLKRLGAAGLSEDLIRQLARSANVDPDNVWQFQAFLQSLLRQLRGDALKDDKQEGNGPSTGKWWQFWKQ